MEDSFLSMSDSLSALNSKLSKLYASNSQKNEARYKNDTLTARERINVILDSDSFFEIDSFRTHRCENFDIPKNYGDGVITGYGTVYGKPVAVFSQDFRYIGGSLGKIHAEKINKIQQFAIKNKMPLIAIQDSGGARIQEGIDALAGYGDIFHNNVKASGYIPQISVIMGPCAGGAVYSPALTDFIFMSGEKSFMFITGPEVVQSVTGESLTKEELGGHLMHSEKSGVSDFFFPNEYDTLMEVRRLITFLPRSFDDKTNIISQHAIEKRNTDWLNFVIPENPAQGYDVKNIITSLVDGGDFLEIGENYAKNIIIGLARISGEVVGFVANQPKFLAGSIDINASRKAARFIRFCDSFNIPIITLVDVPGFLPGRDQEENGIIKHGAKLLYAYSEATVPKITIVTRKAYGGAYIVMGSKHLGSDMNYAWCGAEIAVMGAEGAAKILYKNADNIDEKITEYKEKFGNPYLAADRGYVDAIIEPADTRKVIINALELLKEKQVDVLKKKHDNLPL